ncbi:hypothetical protein BpHYR1_040818 [Brachionus plicatilis]|uniref:Uncharacterized protein n=1 Tax=Brachionus plicatilis TaxID=10195 RepID=A0A3M7RDR3_BRAPC|nr:hypothetical protein BpHYR1_040818 [Brachionus plicatilis]
MENLHSKSINQQKLISYKSQVKTYKSAFQACQIDSTNECQSCQIRMTGFDFTVDCLIDCR